MLSVTEQENIYSCTSLGFETLNFSVNWYDGVTIVDHWCVATQSVQAMKNIILRGVYKTSNAKQMGYMWWQSLRSFFSLGTAVMFMLDDTYLRSQGETIF